MPFATSDGARIFWHADGRPESPPLVMVGSLGSDHAMWNPIMGSLTRFFRVIRIDKRGHGASDAPEGEYTMAQLGRDVLAVADAAGVGRFRYMGLSIGGMIGMWLAGNAPERIERMVITNTSARVDPRTFDERIAAIRAGGVASIADTVLGRFFTPAYTARNTEHRATVRQALLALQPQGYIGCCCAIRDMRLEPLLPAIRVPTLVVAGTYDPSTPAEQGRWIAQTIPGARYLELPTAHFSPSEQPGRFVDAAVRFLLGEDTPDPVLDERTRRLLAVAQSIALGRWDAFRAQVREGLRADLDPGELDAAIAHARAACGEEAARTASTLAAEARLEHEAATRPAA